jgi:hypothetical protein
MDYQDILILKSLGTRNKTMQTKTQNPHILGTRIISKTFKADLAGNVPMSAFLFSVSVKQTFKKTKVLVFERVGANFYTEFLVCI